MLTVNINQHSVATGELNYCRKVGSPSTSNLILQKERKMNTKKLSINLLCILILVSIVFLAACSPVSGAHVVLGQPDLIEEDTSRSWEMGAADIAAAREAAMVLTQSYTAVVGDEDALRSWEMDADDIAAAREAALALSQSYTAAGADPIEEDTSRSWEMDADDIAAAREAALALSQSYTAVGADLIEEDTSRSWEMDADDIAAAREAAQILSHIFVAGGVDHKNPVFQRTAVKLELAH